jgi:hypothetical protein
MQIAVRLEPDVAVRQAGQMLFAMMIGLGDSIGALAPPEIARYLSIAGLFNAKSRGVPAWCVW